MSRPTTAIREWAVPGMPGKPIRLRAAKPGRDGQPGRSLRITYYEPGTLKPRETTAIGMEAAVARAQTILESLTAACLAPSAMSPIPALIDYYLETRSKQKNWSLKTMKGKKDVYRLLPEWFLALLCYQWTIAVSEKVLAEVARKNPPGTEGYRRVGQFLTGMRRCAWRYGYVPRDQDPMAEIDYSVQRKRSGTPGESGRSTIVDQIRPVEDHEIPPFEKVLEFAEVAAWISGCWWEELRIRVWYGAGLRWAESADLRVNRVGLDFENPRVHIVRQAVEVSNGDKTMHVGMAPKSGIVRHAFYDPRLLDLIHRRLFEISKNRTVSSDPDGALLLPSPSGLVYRRSNWARAVGDPAMAACGWPRMSDQQNIPPGMKKAGWLWTPQSLRHGYATWCIRELHIPIALVSEWMGHSTVLITERLYVARDKPKVDTGVQMMRAQGLLPPAAGED